MKKLNLPLTKEDILSLHAGDPVLLSGVILTARDCAHRRIFEYLDRGEKLPFDIEGATIYYAGPCPAKPGMASGSCGPTTSARMNVFAPRLYDLGLNSAIGKGEMSEEVKSALVKNRRCYFAAVGGAGALYGKAIKKSECIAFPDLLSEAVHRLEVVDFPVVVAMDAYGNSIYKNGK
ncbi:MAG: fumarate hydratase C-terminal domain-containing protein [Clostridia bacterium]|nr:fumarate hydratase C-terminal domain-containing protein [Clostridia bacterium]